MGARNRWLKIGLAYVAGLSLLTAGLADFFFYDQAVGWTLGGFVAWLLLLILVRHGKALLVGRQRTWGWVLTLMTVGLIASLVMEPGTIAFILCLIALGSLAMTARGGWGRARLGWLWLGRLIGLWAVALVRPLLDSHLARRWRLHSLKGLEKIKGTALAGARLAWAIAGIVIPLALSLLFIGLFSLANPVVADWVSTGWTKVEDFALNITDYITFSRIMLWYVGLVACWGLLRHRPLRKRDRTDVGPNLLHPAAAGEGDPWNPVQAAAQRKRDGEQPEQTEAEEQNASMLAWLSKQFQNLIVRCLIAMNVVFAVQLTLDSRYLVLGEALPEGMSYAEYAHRGAYPLIVTAILAAAMVLAVFRPGGVAERSVWARRLVLLWIAQNIVLVASAVWRLHAYVEVYTLTRLRVAAAVWMLMVAGCLVLLLWRIARSRDNAWLTGWAMGWGLCVLWVCSFVPFDPMIAQYNVRNCRELGGSAGPIDVAYLEHLGPDALPAIAYLLENLPEDAAEAPPAFEEEPSYGRGGLVVERVDYDDNGKLELEFSSLREQLLEVRGGLAEDLDTQLDDWRGWTPRRQWLQQQAGE